MKSCLDELLRAATEAANASESPRLQLAGLVRAHVGVSAVNPKTARVTDHEIRALSPHHHEELVAIRDQYESVFAHVIDVGARTGAFEVTDRQLVRLALLEMCNGVANWYRPDGRLCVAEVQDRLVEFGCRIVGVEPVTRAELGEAPEPVPLACEPPDTVRSVHHSAQEAV